LAEIFGNLQEAVSKSSEETKTLTHFTEKKLAGIAMSKFTASLYPKRSLFSNIILSRRVNKVLTFHTLRNIHLIHTVKPLVSINPVAWVASANNAVHMLRRKRRVED